MTHQTHRILQTRQATAILRAAMPTTPAILVIQVMPATRVEVLTSQATRARMLRMPQTKAATKLATLQTALQTAVNPVRTSFF